MANWENISNKEEWIRNEITDLEVAQKWIDNGITDPSIAQEWIEIENEMNSPKGAEKWPKLAEEWSEISKKWPEIAKEWMAVPPRKRTSMKI